MSKITPTIGRKLYFYPNGMPTGIPPHTMNDQDSPLDATIVYVWPSTAQVGPEFSLNLYVIDHAGVPMPVHGIPLVQDGEDAPAAPQPYAQWMPFQVGQAKAQETEKAPEVGNVAAAPNVADGAAIATTLVAVTETAKSGDFAFALAWLKAGRPVTREPWKASGAFVYLVPAASYPAQTEVAKKTFGENAMVPYMAYLAIKRTDGTVCVFNPGVDSILAEDWVLVD